MKEARERAIEIADLSTRRSKECVANRCQAGVLDQSSRQVSYEPDAAVGAPVSDDSEIARGMRWNNARHWEPRVLLCDMNERCRLTGDDNVVGFGVNELEHQGLSIGRIEPKVPIPLSLERRGTSHQPIKFTRNRLRGANVDFGWPAA